MQSVTLVLCTLASMLLVDAQAPPPMPGSASPPASKPAMDPLMLMMMMQMGQGSGDNSMMPLMMMMMMGGQGGGMQGGMMLPMMMMMMNKEKCKDDSDCQKPNAGRICGKDLTTAQKTHLEAGLKYKIKACCKCSN